MPELPSGTVTFVFSDLEGSTNLLKQLRDEGYAHMLAVHRQLVRDTFNGMGGSEIDTQGDAFFYSFARARAAVAAAVQLQRRHATQEWPGGVKVRVRLGLHTGEPIVGEEGYTGIDVVRAARIAADGRGGQILLSEATRALIGNELPEGVAVLELGARTLKDLDHPEPIFELVYDDAQNELADAEVVPADAEVVPADAAAVTADTPPALPAEFLEDFNPARLIEERVLKAIGQSLREHGEAFDSFQAGIPGPPTWAVESGDKTGFVKGGGGVADELDRLRALRDAGALTDEQYSRAVDRVLDGAGG